MHDLDVTWSDFLGSIHNADWKSAEDIIATIDFVPESVDLARQFSILFEIDAPESLIEEFIKRVWLSEGRVSEKQGMAERCLDFAQKQMHKDKAQSAFRVMMKCGMSPNGFMSSGETLFQYAVSLNLVDVTKLLICGGVDKNMKSVFGSESESNIEYVKAESNAASSVARKYWSNEP